MDKLHIYEKRMDKYVSYFKYYVGNAKVICERRKCSAMLLSKALTYEKHLVIALGVEKKLLKEIESSLY
jgi:hypothetical protein